MINPTLTSSMVKVESLPSNSSPSLNHITVGFGKPLDTHDSSTNSPVRSSISVSVSDMIVGAISIFTLNFLSIFPTSFSTTHLYDPSSLTIKLIISIDCCLNSIWGVSLLWAKISPSLNQLIVGVGRISELYKVFHHISHHQSRRSIPRMPRMKSFFEIFVWKLTHFPSIFHVVALLYR